MSDESILNPWRIRKCVLPQHTDHAGVMWHGSYLSWLEEARVDALEQVGLPYKDLVAKGFELPVVSLNINYTKSLFHGESVLLESYSQPRKLARWPWSTKFIAKGSVVAEASVYLVLVRRLGDKHKLIRNIPNEFASYFLKLQLGPNLE